MAKRKLLRKGRRYTPMTHCWKCKVEYVVVQQPRRRSHPFGWGTYVLRNGKRDAGTITFSSSITQCPKCGDAFYTYEQADAASRASTKATLRLYRKRLGYRDALYTADEKGKRTPRRLPLRDSK